MGKLYVNVLSASSLEDKDMKGASDPYVIVKCEGAHYKTKTVNDNSNPEWNEEFTFEVKDTNNDLILEVKDSDVFKDECLGFISFPLATMSQKKKKHTYTLQKVKAGTITLEICAEGFGRGEAAEEGSDMGFPTPDKLSEIFGKQKEKRDEERKEKKEKKKEKEDAGEDAEDLSDGPPESVADDDDEDTKTSKLSALTGYFKKHRKEDRADLSKKKKEEHSKKKEEHQKRKDDGDEDVSSDSSSDESSDYDSSDEDEEKKEKKAKKKAEKDKKSKKKDKEKRKKKGDDVSDDSDSD